jgi:hypothetical protein
MNFLTETEFLMIGDGPIVSRKTFLSFRGIRNTGNLEELIRSFQGITEL